MTLISFSIPCRPIQELGPEWDSMAICEHCGGRIPREGSASWDSADEATECPGKMASTEDGTYRVCGAFDPVLSPNTPALNDLQELEARAMLAGGGSVYEAAKRFGVKFVTIRRLRE